MSKTRRNILLALLLALPALPAASIRVDGVRGSDRTGKGTPSQPYRSLTKGLSQARSGDEVLVAPGTYDGRLGERFPLTLEAGVDLRGLAGPRAVFIVCDNPWVPVLQVKAGKDSRARLADFTLVGGWTALQVESTGGGQQGSRLELARLALEDGGCALSLATASAAPAGVLDLTLDDCLLAGHWGNGVQLLPAAGTLRCLLRNTVVQNNGGTGLVCRPAAGVKTSLELVHCTVARNGSWGLAGDRPGIALTARNSILWGNGQGDYRGVDGGGIHHCLLATGAALGSRGNRSGDPAFLDARDWHLGRGSAALGIGDPGPAGLPPRDLDGQLRPPSTAPDAGADQQELHTLTQDPRGMRIYRDFTLRAWTWPGASVAFLISYDTVTPGFSLPPLEGLLQLDYTKALELAGSGTADARGILDFRGSGFRSVALLGSAVAFQGVAFNRRGALTEGHFTGAVKTWFLDP